MAEQKEEEPFGSHPAAVASSVNTETDMDVRRLFLTAGIVLAVLFCEDTPKIQNIVFGGAYTIATVNKTRINEDIRAAEVRLIGPEGQLGIKSLSEALRIAGDLGLDLVEVSPDAKPPVCKIMDYGKYHFEKEKKEKEQRRKKPSFEIKEIQLRCRIDTHDFNTKLKHCVEFLQKGNKVKVTVRFYGREMAHTEVGRELLMRFVAGCGEAGIIEKQPLLEGRNMMLMMAPKKADNKSKESKESKGTENSNGKD